MKYGEDGAEMADVYLAYGKALLENAIQQAGVLGKEQQPGGDAEDDKGELIPFVHCVCGMSRRATSVACALTIEPPRRRHPCKQQSLPFVLRRRR